MTATTDTQPAYRLKNDRFDHKAGTVVYAQKYHDYGLASDDTRHTGIEHVSVSLKPDGGYPGFTVPKHQLEPIPAPPAVDFLANSKACDLSNDTGCEACQ